MRNRQSSWRVRLRRLAPIAAMVPIVLVGTAASPSSASAADSYCAPADDGSYSQYCQINTTGGSGTGATGTTGITKVWLNWPLGGDVIDGHLCVADTWGNGRGVKVKLAFHRYGMPTSLNSTNYDIKGPYKDKGNTSCPSGTSDWYTYSASQLSGGFDYALLEWADTWSGCSYCPQGRYKIVFPDWSSR
ncbi:hypothetical protein ACIBG8_05235 [Nonomuraea sp. NPDC050556]|uniref:hypothetical protein n=1 Tax=Nonomuraea sp. NPDC050556 TaxID=3364369 RepID=UPI0037996F43